MAAVSVTDRPARLNHGAVRLFLSCLYRVLFEVSRGFSADYTILAVAIVEVIRHATDTQIPGNYILTPWFGPRLKTFKEIMKEFLELYMQPLKDPLCYHP